MTARPTQAGSGRGVMEASGAQKEQEGPIEGRSPLVGPACPSGNVITGEIDSVAARHRSPPGRRPTTGGVRGPSAR